MGNWITQTDLEQYFGTSNIAKWSNMENDEAGADTEKIARAITYGEEYIADRFRDSMYVVPFVAIAGVTPIVLLHWMTVFAGAYLYEARGFQDTDEDARFAKLKEAAEMQMAECVSGQRRLQLVKSSSTDVTGPGVAI